MINENTSRQHSVAATTLYASRICPFSQRALLAALEADLKFEYVDIEFMARPQWFVNLTPFGKVPVLVDKGTTVVESLVIIEYINETKDMLWLGKTSDSKAFHRAWMLYCDKLHDMTRNYFVAKDENKREENIFLLNDSLKKANQFLTSDHFFNSGGQNLSALGIVYAPLFILLNCLEEKTGRRLFSISDSIHGTVRRLLSHPSVAMINNDFYKKELVGFIDRINPTLFRQEAVL